MTLVSNETSFKWHLFQMTLVSNDTCFKWHLFQMTLVSNDTCLKWHLSQMTLVSNDTCFKWHLFQMTLVSNDTCFTTFVSNDIRWHQCRQGLNKQDLIRILKLCGRFNNEKYRTPFPHHLTVSNPQNINLALGLCQKPWTDKRGDKQSLSFIYYPENSCQYAANSACLPPRIDIKTGISCIKLNPCVD